MQHKTIYDAHRSCQFETVELANQYSFRGALPLGSCIPASNAAYLGVGRDQKHRRGPLELSFETRHVRDLCEKSTAAISSFDETVASRLRARISDLGAASSVRDIVAGNPRANPACDNEMIIDLANSHQIVLCANHAQNPEVSDGGIDWSSVYRIKILRISQTP